VFDAFLMMITLPIVEQTSDAPIHLSAREMQMEDHTAIAPMDMPDLTADSEDVGL